MSGASNHDDADATVCTAGRARRLDVLGERTVSVGFGLLIITGFVSSYTTLRDLAVGVGGFSPWLAPVVPLSFDLGIIVLSLKVILAARAGRDARVLRVLVLVLSVATVGANGAASSTSVGRLLHAVPPAVFVLCFEALVASARHDAETRRAATSPDPSGVATGLPVLTAARWLLAPRQTWAIWRARVLAVAPPAAVAPTAAALPSPDTSGEWTAERRPEPPVAAITGPPRQPASGRQGKAAVSASARSTGHHDRSAVAVEALRADPAMTAVALAEHLGGAGHPVSVRTAQRIRHHAEEQLAAPPPCALTHDSDEGRWG